MTPDQNQYEQLKNLIGQDKLEEVFKQLHELIPADAPESTSLILLEGQFRSNQREEQLNKTDRDAIRRTTTHISEGLLMLIDSLTEEQIQLETIAQLSFNDRLHRIRAFFTDYDRLPHAFSHLEHLLKEYSPNLLTELNDLRVKLNANRKEYIIKRKIERQTYLQSSGQIVEGLEELIRQLSETETNISGKDVQFGSELSKVNCDRKKILRRFLRAFEENESAAIPQHIYLLSHQKFGEAKSLTRRLITQLKQQYPKVKYSSFQQIPIYSIGYSKNDDFDDLEDFKDALIVAFNFSLYPQAKNLYDFLQKIDRHYPKFNPWTYLPFVLEIKIPADEWEQIGVPGLQWFMTAFCHCEQRQKRIPALFLIIDIAEPEQQPKVTPSGWRRFFQKKQQIKQPVQLDIFAELKKLAEQLPPHVTLLPPLTRIVEADLHDWYSNYEHNERKRERKVNEMIQDLGPSANGWDMSEVEKHLEKIIDSYQEDTTHNI